MNFLAGPPPLGRTPLPKCMHPCQAPLLVRLHAHVRIDGMLYLGIAAPVVLSALSRCSPRLPLLRSPPLPPPMHATQGAVNHPQLMADFYAPVYRDDATGQVSLRGPTMRVRQGEVLTINLRNNLTRPGGESHAGLNGFTHVADTNMHVHGMHSYPGGRGVLDECRWDASWRGVRRPPCCLQGAASGAALLRLRHCSAHLLRAGVAHQHAGVLDLANYVDNDNIL